MSVDAYISMWNSSVSSRNSFPLNKEFALIGEANLPGIRGQSTIKVFLRIEPSEKIEIQNEVPLTADLVKAGFPGTIAIGLFDVMGNSEATLLSKFRVVIESIENNSASISKMDLREAAKDAGRKILQEIGINQ